MIGLAAKPMVGALDLVSNIGEGIRNTTTVFDTPERDRVRMPRLIPADGYLRVSRVHTSYIFLLTISTAL